MHMSAGSHRSQREILDLPEAAVKRSCEFSNQTQSAAAAAEVLLTADSSLSPHFPLFFFDTVLCMPGWPLTGYRVKDDIKRLILSPYFPSTDYNMYHHTWFM